MPVDEEGKFRLLKGFFTGTANNMHVHLVKSKIHRAEVTDSSLNYEGSLGIDLELMQMVDIFTILSVTRKISIFWVRLWVTVVSQVSNDGTLMEARILSFMLLA